ncbi:MAG: hypothetical protein Q9199_002751 [Rusavskia elegans]
MEVAGLVVGIVSLYNATIGILGRVDAYKKFGAESQTSSVHFEAAKVRLQDWAVSVGIRDGKLADHHSPRLDEPNRASIIKMALECLKTLLDEVEHTSSSFKLPIRRPTAEADLWPTPFDETANKPEHHQAISKRSRLNWAMGGREKLNRNIAVLEGLVNVLYQVAIPGDGGAGHWVPTLPSEENDAPFSASEAALKSTQESLIALDRRDILDWVDALKYDDEYEKHVSLHLNGTCEWIIGHTSFSDWVSNHTLDTGTRFLWIHGPAGFGKTVLSAWLIRYIKETLKLPVACCFSSSHAQRTEDFDNIIRTWITQLAQNSIEVLNQCQIARREHSGRRASRVVIWSLLKRVLPQLPSCILALDGLDEFRDVNESRGLFLEDLKKAVASTQVRIVITSRNEPDIEVQLRASATQPKEYTMLECKLSNEDVKSDLGLYSQAVVAKRFPKQDETYRDDLSAQLAQKADGMFLWIKLQQSQLRGSQSRKTVQRIVKGMPHGLDQTYERNWNSIQELPEPDRNRALNILRWLTFGIWSLTVQGLVEALIIEVDESSEAFCEDDLPADIDAEYINNEIKGLCRSFIDIRDGTENTPPGMKTVHLAHGSVRELLITILPIHLTAGPFPEYNIRVAAHHAILASHCLRYLNHAGAWDTDKEGYYRSFTEYAVDSWYEHVQRSYVNHQDHDGVSTLLHAFLRSENIYFRKWQMQFVKIGVKNEDEDDEEKDEAEVATPQVKPSAVYYACLFSLDTTIDLLLNIEDEDFNSVGGPSGTPLQLACVNGKESIFERLMRRGADNTVRGGMFGTAINAAAYMGHHKMVKSLLEREGSTAQSRSRILEAVKTAATKGYLEIVELLLDGGAVALSGPESDQEKLTCLSDSLYEAAFQGHLTVVKSLLERGADINVRNSYSGQTPLHAAVEENHLEVVAELAERGANVAVHDKHGYTPLHWSALRGYTEIATCLLSHGTDVNTEIDAGPDIGHHALYLATFWNRQDVLSLLLDKNAEVDKSGPKGWRAIHLAARDGFVDVLLRLIHGGADVHSQDDSAWTPLHCAVYSGQNAAAELLLQHGADVNAQDGTGETPMHAIFWSKHEIHDQQRLTMIQLLLVHGADPNIPNVYGETPLFHAVRSRYTDATRYLISKGGCNIDTKNKFEQTPLHIAIEHAQDHDRVDDQQCPTTIQLLFDHSADPNISDDLGETPLFYAVRSQNIDATRYLISKGGCNIDAKNKFEQTLLHVAIERAPDHNRIDNEQYLTMIQLLFDHSADPHISDNEGETPLFYAVRYRRIQVTRSLTLKIGCDINAKNKFEQTPLRVAIEFAPDEHIEDLLLHGADLSAMDQNGMTCLDWIKRQRPRLLESEILLQVLSDVAIEHDVTILRRMAIERTKGIASTLKGDVEFKDDFYILCTSLLLLDMELDALLAHQLTFLAQKGNTDCIPFCDGCSTRQTRDDPFYKCKICPNTDFCQECMAKYNEPPLSEICRSHEFLRVVASEARITPDQTEALETWLLGIEERLKAAEIDMKPTDTPEKKLAQSAAFDTTTSDLTTTQISFAMTDNTNVNDVINPITALALVKDQSGTVRLLLAGEGPYLKVFEDSSGRLIAIKRVFGAQAIHGILAIAALNDHDRDLDGVAEVLIWGGRCVRPGLLRYGPVAGPVAGPLRVEIELKEELILDDWILSGCFDPVVSEPDEPEWSKSRWHNAVVLTAHNVAYGICQDKNQQSIVKRVVAGPDSMLYSAHIEWTEPGRCLVASGTVFGNILLWSFAESAVRADAVSPGTSQLHHKFAGHEGSVFGVRISPDLWEQGFGDVRRLLASCSDDRTIRLWDISDIEPSGTNCGLGSQNDENSTPLPKRVRKSTSSGNCVAMIMGHSSRIWDVRFLISDHGTAVLSFGEDSTTQTWELTRDQSPFAPFRSKVLLLSHKHSYAYHSGKSIWANAHVQRQDGTQTVCTGGADGRIVQYDVLDHYGSTDAQALSSKWTMQDIANQLGKSQTPCGDDARSPDPSPEKTLCEYVFDALKGTWTINRDIKSALPASPSGIFSGEAQFNNRPPTAPEFDKEYLYIENGEFTTDQGLTFTATRRYVYRYQQASDLMSAWFVKPDDNIVVDYLFHEIRLHDRHNFTTRDSLPANGVIKASSYHLCVKDHYTPSYVLHLMGGYLQDWKLTYGVKGPQKDYVAEASYARKENTFHLSNDEKLPTTSEEKNLSAQISLDRQFKEDSLRSYVFLTDKSFLVTTAQGRVLVGSLLSSAGYRPETGQGGVDPSAVEWKLAGQYDALRSSSLVARAVGSNFILLGGHDGTISFYNRSIDRILPMMHLKRKLAFIYAQKVHFGPPEIQAHFVLVVCLGMPIAYMYEISDNDLHDRDVARQPIKLTLPAFFVVTSACYLSRLRLWVLGSRNGVVAIYNEATAQHDFMLEPCNIVADVHGPETITVIHCLSDHDKNQPSLVLTAGRDGHYAVHEITIISVRILSEEVPGTLHTVHRSTPPFGPNIEGAALDSQTQELIIWGFRSKQFVVWNASKDMETMNVDCGGAHRNWYYSPHNDGSNGGTFVWTKASICYVHSQANASHRVLSSGGHGREIKAMAISPILVKHDGAEAQYIATGAEDTTIRIWSYLGQKDESGSAFRCLGTFRKHTTGIQQLRWSADGSLLFSAAGCEEFFVWRVQPVPFLGIGAVCEAVCPKITNDGDLRVMDFTIAEVLRCPQRENSLIEKCYVVNVVYSDSSIRVYRYPSTYVDRSFLLLQSSTYTTHCLTAASYLCPQTLNDLCTASSDGHIAFWPTGGALIQTPAQEIGLFSAIAIHQNSIKSMFTISLDSADLDCLIITGGDDGALGITRRVVSKASADPITSTLLIPKAHAAAINAVEYLQQVPHSKPSHTYVFVSSGNDQRLKTWIVRLNGHDTASNPIEGIAVRLHSNQHTSVADVSSLSAITTAESVGVVVAGIGMECFADMTSEISSSYGTTY